MKTKRVMPCEVFARVVGFYRPTSNWNVGKKQEWKDRELIDLNKQPKDEK